MSFSFFWLRKIVSRFFFPVPVILELGLLGAVLLIWQRTRRRGVILLLLSQLLLAICSLPILADSLLRGLEQTHPPLTEAALLDWSGHETTADPLIIGVAGSGFQLRNDGNQKVLSPENESTTLTREDLWAGFTNDFLVRLQEAGRIARLLEKHGCDYQLAVSISSSVSMAVKIAALEQYYASFDINPQKLVLVDNAQNSKAEIDCFAGLGEALILVSSAYHVPRLVRLAAKQQPDLPLLTAPAGYTGSNPLFFIPAADGLNNLRIVVYEYLGKIEAMKFTLKRSK